MVASSSAVIIRQPYLFYLVLGESIFSEISCILTVIINIRILYIIFFYLKKRKIDLSPILIFHVTFWIFLSIAWLIQNTYVIIFWKHNTIKFNPQILWYTGMASLSLVPIPAVALLFSTLERCAIFIFHNYNTIKRIQCILFISTCFISFLVWAILIFSFIFSAPIEFLDTTSCLSPNCLSQNNIVDSHLNAITIAIASISLIGACLLGYFIRTLHFKSPTHRAATLLTIQIVFIQIFLDFIINAFAFLTPLFFHESPSNILGSYIRVISSLNGFICSIIFSKTIERLKKQAENSVKIIVAQSKSSPKNNNKNVC